MLSFATFFYLFREKFMKDGHMESDARYLTMSEIMTPDNVNFRGHIHGGYILGLLDRVAYACAARYAAKTVVTLSVDQVFFKEPIFVSELVIFHAAVNFVGKTSIEVGIKVVAENLLTRLSRHTNTCFFTMVAVDDNGKPTAVPPLTLNTEKEKQRFEAGKARREMRLQMAAHKKRV
jgi:acyl-CoA hydrolase